MASCFWKFLLISVNAIVLLLSIPIFIGGTLIMDAEVDRNTTNDDGKRLTDEEFGHLEDAVHLIGYMLLVAGAFAILVCLAGICGACMENKCMLCYYIVFATIFLVFTVIVGAVGGATLEKADADGKDIAYGMNIVVPIITFALIVSAFCLKRDPEIAGNENQ